MPSVSRAQQKAMFAAKSGKSTIGIPQKVGAEFAAADEARGPAKLPARAPQRQTAGDPDAVKPKSPAHKQAMVNALKGE